MTRTRLPDRRRNMIRDIAFGGQTFTVNQAAAGCTYSINPGSANAVAAGETETIAVTSLAGCAWTAASNSSWLTVTSGASGSGNGTVALSVAANPAASPRTGTATIAGQTFTVNQAAAPCGFHSPWKLRPSSASSNAPRPRARGSRYWKLSRGPLSRPRSVPPTS